MTVYSALKSRVCCTPQPAKGSLRFARAASPCHPKATRFVGVRSPQRGSHPSKISPRQQPIRITAAVAFLPLPSCPARIPTEAGVLADRRVPKRATYTRSSLPWRAGPSCPEGRGVRSRAILPRGAGGPGVRRGRSFPTRRGARCAEARRLPYPVEARRPVRRSAPFALPRGWGPSRRDRARGAPRSLGCPVPVRPG
jgi:hypothetical protein